MASSLFSEEGELDDPEPDRGDPPVEEDLVGCTETEIKRQLWKGGSSNVKKKCQLGDGCKSKHKTKLIKT